jgi:outer membrane protein OmpA-like peptidoglycan-associated protein
LKLINIFQKYPKTNIIVEGHTDSTGSEAYNMDLSKKRAQSVTDYLAANGISNSRIETNWYGEEQPKYDNSTEEGRSKNRRVEVAIVANQELKEEAKQKAQ